MHREISEVWPLYCSLELKKYRLHSSKRCMCRTWRSSYLHEAQWSKRNESSWQMLCLRQSCRCHEVKWSCAKQQF